MGGGLRKLVLYIQFDRAAVTLEFVDWLIVNSKLRKAILRFSFQTEALQIASVVILLLSGFDESFSRHASSEIYYYCKL